MSAQAVRAKALAEAMQRTKAQRLQEEAASRGDGARKTRRKQTALPGLLSFEEMRVTVPCTITDMSGTGARLAFTHETLTQFGDLEHLPQRYTLILRADRMQVEVETRWRKPGRIGVRFLSPPQPIAKRR